MSSGPTFSQNNKQLTITIDGTEDDSFLLNFHGDEALSQPFFYRLHLLSNAEAMDPDSLLGASVGVDIHDLYTDTSHGFHGKVLRLTRETPANPDPNLFEYRMELVPDVWFLKYRSTFRILTDQKASDIIATVLGDAGITHGTIPASTIVRQYTVQYGETDFDFISRLMEEEGIFYYFERSNSAHKILFGNTINDYANAPDETATVGVDLIQLERSSELVTNKYRHTDYDFRATAAVESDGYETKTTFSNKTMTGEIHEYGSPSPAEQNSTPLQSGLDLVSEVNQQALDATSQILSGEGIYCSWSPGYKVDFGGDLGSHVLTSVTHNYGEAHGLDHEVDESYSNLFRVMFTAIDATVVFRPPRVTPQSRIYGVQSAIVDLPADGEAGSDTYGEVKVKFYWAAEDQSCWVRVAQPWASVEYGTVFLPRVGDEVLVQFINGNPERPVIIGSVYNSTNLSPSPQTETDLASGIWTQNDEGQHILNFDDTSGSEMITFQSSKDFKRIVSNEDILEVGVANGAPGDQKVTIKNSRTVEIQDADDNLNVVSGNLNISADAGEITLEAATKITLKVGGSSIVLEAAGVTVKGTQVEVNGSGQTTIKGGIVNIN